MTKAQTPREVALMTLEKVLQQKSYSNLQLNQALKKSQLEMRDQALVTQLVYGTIQHKIFLEYQIKDLLRTEPKNAFVRPILLLSLYQLFFLDKIPDHAVINEANLLAKKYTNGNLYKMINAILRNVQRQGVILPEPEGSTEYLSVKESMPVWLVQYFEKNFGSDKTAQILASYNTVPHNSVRVNTNEISVDAAQAELEAGGYTVTPSKLNPENLILNKGQIAQTALFQTGMITIQDEAASAVVKQLNVQPDDQVLDACAAPGGKTMQIAQILKQGHGHVVALDLHQKKLQLIDENKQRMGLSAQISTKALDARKAGSEFEKQSFDKILVDAPCSGLGLMRRKPEIRYEKSLQDIQNLSKIQLEILDALVPLLKNGGSLVYSTCTITMEENEQVVAAFLAKHDKFIEEKISIAKYQEQQGIKIFPDDYQTDGFFITKLTLRG